MALLQPTDVPSRTGINAAISSTVDEHADPLDAAGEHYDSGWQTLVLRANFGISGETPMYRRIGNVIYLRGRVIPTSGNWTTGNTAFADIPAGFRPGTSNVLFASTSGSPGVPARFFITSAGVCNANLLTGTGTGAIHLSCAYPN